MEENYSNGTWKYRMNYIRWNAALLGKDAMSLDKRFPRFRRNEVPAFIFRGSGGPTRPHDP
jgi:hypothetical protein